jgi:hypothetical protein
MFVYFFIYTVVSGMLVCALYMCLSLGAFVCFGVCLFRCLSLSVCLPVEACEDFPEHADTADVMLIFDKTLMGLKREIWSAVTVTEFPPFLLTHQILILS